jgi:hypothetical protein
VQYQVYFRTALAVRVRSGFVDVETGENGGDFPYSRRSHQNAPDHHAGNVLPIIREIQGVGATTHRANAAALNARGVPTARGGRWQAMTGCSNVLARA